MRSIFIVIYVFLFLLLGLPVLGLMWIIGKFNKPWADMAQLRIVQWAFRCIIFMSGSKLDIRGEENIPKDEAVLYIGNHRSFFDIIITYSRCPRLTGYISKKSINGKTELPGAKLKITDKDGKLEKDLDGKSLIWTSSTKEERFRLAPGSYILTELEAPKGYELSDAVIEFTVTEDGRILFDKKEAENNMIVFKNTPEPEQVVTGSSLIYILFLGIITAGVVTFFVLKRND